MKDVINGNQLRIVSFIQDESTREVYQVAKDIIVIGSGLIDPPGSNDNAGFVIFPNPASQRAYILFDNEVEKDAGIIIYNNLGSIVGTTRIVHGENRTELPVSELPAGIYMIRAFSGNEILGVRKLTVTR
jgi:hypothetical protein